MVRVRFAPSPTGRLHIGNARTALFNWVFARKNNGKFILRIEDTDLERSQQDFIKDIIEDLKWLGLVWDEGPDVGGEYGPYIQSQRMARYEECLDKLDKIGLLYECFCTAEELEARREKLLSLGHAPRYDNRCRTLSREEKEKYRKQGRKSVLRFKVPENKIVIIRDLIRGEVQFDTAIMGDFVVRKSDGMPMFNFAVCVDDYLMKISHIIRGEDHLSNTPRHVLIFEALGAKVPEFAHMSMTMGQDGEKLSKRMESVSIGHYRKVGYMPEALFNYLALLGWSPKTKDEIISKQEIIAHFNISDMNKSAALFDPAKLDWVSGQYTRNTDIGTLTINCLPYLKEAGFLKSDTDNVFVTQVVSALKEHLKKASDITVYAGIFFNEEISFDKAAEEILKQEEAKTVLKKLVGILNSTASAISVESFKAMMKEIQAQTNIKGKNLYLPARVAITGKIEGPELVAVLPLLGREVCIKRIERALAI